MSKKKTHKEYVIEVAEIYPNIEVVEMYIDAKTNILHRCKVDGCEWYAKPNNILNGKGCPRCSKKERKTHKFYIAEVAQINPNIEIIEQYINARTPILHKCKIDGHQWMATPTSILSGHGCPICAGNKQYTPEEYVKKVTDINSNIEVVEKYIDAFTPILHRCKIDGQEWMARPSAILYGSGCPRCNSSKGEKVIENWFNKKNILYEPQKKFADCKYLHSLPFDFYLPNYNICIEYQGIQHYKPIEYFGGQKSFESQILRDKIKEEYCKQNNISLFKIPYFANIEEELERLYNFIIKTKNIEKGVAA